MFGRLMLYRDRFVDWKWPMSHRPGNPRSDEADPEWEKRSTGTLKDFFESSLLRFRYESEIECQLREEKFG